MNNLIANENLAKQYLEVSLKYKQLDKFLCGEEPVSLVLKGPNGENVFSAMHVMEAIYDKYKEDIQIEKQVFDTIISVLQTSNYEDDILNLLEDIEYQMNCEKLGTAPFKMNCEQLLKEVKNNIIKNEKRYKTPNSYYESNSAWGELEIHDKKVSDFGHKIL